MTLEAESKILWRSAGIAGLVEFLALVLVGSHLHWMTHPQRAKGLDPSQFIEAQVFQAPKLTHLIEQTKASQPKSHEAVLSKVPGKGQKKPLDHLEDKNQTESGPGLAPTHGPVAVYAPAPVIPDYLKDQDISTSVVIDFFVNARGQVTPQLVGSSGNEELDALALSTAQKWQFRPAEKDHKPVDSKVRLRINFQVH